MKKIFIYGDECLNYKNAVENAGGKAVVSLNAELARECDGLILPGGGDISPCMYGSAEKNCRDTDIKRDCTEQYLIAVFLRKKSPIMGVCRGMQAINVYFGGTLNQTIPEKSAHFNEAADVYHDLKLNKRGFLYEIYKKPVISVNSAHRQSVGARGFGLFLSSVSPDGVFESLENLSKKIIAVQFHPERMAGGGKIYEYFLTL